MTTLNVTEQLNAMQHMLLSAPQLSETLRKNACSFWDNQDKVLDAMQAFSDGWFERRHAGTHAALEAAQRMCKAETPVDLLREYQDWAGGAFQRLAADGMACQQQWMAVVSSIVPPLVPLRDEQQADTSSVESQDDGPRQGGVTAY
jgi:hypothetical protein